MGKLLGGGLKWLASFGTGTLSGLIFYGLAQIGVAEGMTAPVLFAFIIAAVAKLVGWLVATYGPSPTNVSPG